jgi:hypothetical protein
MSVDSVVVVVDRSDRGMDVCKVLQRAYGSGVAVYWLEGETWHQAPKWKDHAAPGEGEVAFVLLHDNDSPYWISQRDALSLVPKMVFRYTGGAPGANVGTGDYWVRARAFTAHHNLNEREAEELLKFAIHGSVSKGGLPLLLRDQEKSPYLIALAILCQGYAVVCGPEKMVGLSPLAVNSAAGLNDEASGEQPVGTEIQLAVSDVKTRIAESRQGAAEDPRRMDWWAQVLGESDVRRSALSREWAGGEEGLVSAELASFLDLLDKDEDIPIQAVEALYKALRRRLAM